MLRQIVTGAFAIVVFLAHPTTTPAQERLRIGWASLAATHTPIWIAEDKGFFRQYGLDPEVIFFSASPTAIQGLLAGELDIIASAVSTVVSPRLAGSDVIMFLTLVPTITNHIVVPPTITRPEQLKGKIGGVNRIGSITETGLRLALRRMGLDPEKDIKLISTGGNPERLGAMSKGITQFTILTEPFLREAEKLGYRALIDLATLKVPIHWNGAVTKESIIKPRRPMLLRFARAMVAAIHYIKTDKEGTKAVMGKYLRLNDPEGLERAYKVYAPVFPEVPYPAPEGVKTLLDDMAPRTPKAATADAKTFVDMTFVQELESSGFIKQLYRK